MPRFVGTLVALIALGVNTESVRADEAASKVASGTMSAVDFPREILPILQAKCCRCHGEKEQKADLDLSTFQGVLKGGESGVAVVPLKPEDSLLYEKVHSGEMPPEEKDRLSDREIQTIQRWIASGAKPGASERGADSESSNMPSQHDIVPIMLRRCSACHGLRRKEAGLDLRTKAGMLRGGKSGPAIVLGNPNASRVIQKIHAGEMPPRDRLVEVSIKPIEPGETAVLAKWITAGAPEVAIEPDVATTDADTMVTDADRKFWAFQAPQPVAVPQVSAVARVANPIDAFVLQRLEQSGLILSPEADRVTLLRRAYFDLTGLPPTPPEIEAFLTDQNPRAYEHLIDRLLSSPRYGERWGRYWLDLAGYADSEGKREQDLPRPHAWRFRDYVIRSLNTDKPFDRFLLEQIAGDELADYEHAPEMTETIYDNLVATAFLRMAPDATWANITGYAPDRIEVIADEMDVLGSGILGLTLKCSRCHSHKFDPIPQRDYYRLLDIFKGAFDEYDWLKPDVRPGIGPVSQDVLGGRHLPHVPVAERQAWEKQNAQLNQEIAAAKAKPGSEELVKQLERRRKPEPRIQAVWDRGEPSPTYIYRRGEWLRPGRLVGPGVPSVLTDGKTPFVVQPPWPGAKQTGRRLAFAKWLTQPNHPLTARVHVNQIWKHHFGTGIVKTLGNFGKSGTLPTHPELLDWLAREFVRQGWSLKAMHRLMMTSATYRQSSAVTALHMKVDPKNLLLSRMPLLRLDAEALYDSLLLIAGRLDESRFGPPDTVTVRADGLVTPAGTARGWRRLIYVKQARKQLATHLENFDFPQMNPNCIERRESLVAPQALHLMNNAMVYQLAEHFASRVVVEVGSDPAKQVERIYWLALNRKPTSEEGQIGVEFLNQVSTPNAPAPMPQGGPTASDTVPHKGLTAFCHAIMNSAGFLYVD